jgi:uncharacterized membrane protein
MTKFALPLVLALAACDSSTAAFDEAAAPVEGIYRVTQYTRNDAACAPGQTSLLGQDTFAVAFMQDIFGTPVLSLMSCGSIADCRVKVADMRAEKPVQIEWMFSVNEVGDNNVLIGRGADSGFREDGVCTKGEAIDTEIALAGSQLRIERAITIANDYLPDNGFCTTELARKFAKGNTCSQMEVVTAELVEAL